MKVMTFKRLSILSLVLLAASAATAFIAKDKKDAQAKNGLLVAGQTSTGNTCRTALATENGNCNDTGADNVDTSSAGDDGVLTTAPTSTGHAGNTSGMD